MKKILAFLLVATMLCAMFVMPSAAEDYINYEVEVEDTKSAPKIDGKVGKTEYGPLPIHTYSESKSQFAAPDDHDEYDNWDFSFYMTWDKDNLYMAWVVETEIHHGLEEGTYTSDGTKTADTWPDGDPSSMLGHMWWNSCIQFIITPGAPKKGETTYGSSNYLEAGIALLGDGTQARMIWKTPAGYALEDINVNDWNAAIIRDDAAKTTTYEVAIPWKYTTVNAMGDSAKFGLSYAVAAQENYNVKKGMIEWQDAVLGSKQGDNAAVISLKSKDIGIIEVGNGLKEGELSDEAKAAEIKLVLDDVNKTMGAEGSMLITDLDVDDIATTYGLNYSHSLLLKPVDGDEYEVVEAITGSGEGTVAFTTEIEDGMIIAAYHSDGNDGASGKVRCEDAKKVGVGSKVVLFGVKDDKLEYTNSMIWVKELVAPSAGEESVEDSSVEESSEAESVEESSEAESVEESSEAESVEESTDTTDENEGGLGVWLWVIIGAAVVVVAVVVVVILKKKK